MYHRDKISTEIIDKNRNTFTGTYRVCRWRGGETHIIVEPAASTNLIESVGDGRRSLGWTGQCCFIILSLKATINHCLKKNLL